MKNSGTHSTDSRRQFTHGLRHVFFLILILLVASSEAAGVVLKLGDILAIEPGNASVVVLDPATGAKTTISQGGLLFPPYKVIGVALAVDGNVICVCSR